MICYICESITDFTCEKCKEPVCEDCCVPMTLQNQIDYAFCTLCQGADEAAHWARIDREERQQAAIKAEKEKKSAARKARYYLPENVAKRKAAKIERKRLRAEEEKERLKSAVKIVSEMFRGMF